MISLYEPDLEGNSFKILNSFTGLDGDVLGLDFNISKNVIAAGSSNGKIIFWNLDKIDQQYKCDIAINANITTLAWNKKVSRILCAGTDDGRILVLDIRAKNIAMTLENPEIKTVSNLSWHPNCPTSIFASTNLNCLHSFNLSTDSMSTIGDHKVLGFDILDDKTLIAYSKERINYIDIDKQQIRNYEEVEGLFEASFSHRDPLCCLSNSNGFTTISSRRDESIALRNPQKIFMDYVLGENNYVLGTNNYKIKYPEMIKITQNDLSHSLMKLIYKEGKFNLTNKNRKEVAKLIFDSDVENGDKESVADLDINGNIKIDSNDFDLNDPVIVKLIKHDFENIQSCLKNVDLKSVLNLLQKKEVDCKNNPIEYLLYLYSTGKYEEMVQTLPSSQWKIMISILLFSDYSLENCYECFKIILNQIEKEEDKQILFLLTNNPKEILNITTPTKSSPSSVFEINEFFAEYIPIVEKIKALKIKSEDKYLDEFVRYAKDHGLYELVKDLDHEKMVEKVSEKALEKITISNKEMPKKSFVSPPQPNQNVNKNVSYPPQPSQNVYPPQPSQSNVYPPQPSQTPSSKIYPPQSNRSSTPTERPRGPAIPRVVPSMRQNIRPPIGRPDVGSQSIPTPSSGFCTRPPVKSPLYSCPSSGSTPNFSGNVRPPGKVPSTYGSENSSYLAPKTPPLPHQGIKGVIPKPSVHPTPNPSTTSRSQSTDSFYDKIGLSTDFENIYEKLREEASKKNNLIIGNKIKDANRRFSVFQNLDKLSLTNNVLYKMNLLVQTFKDVTEKNLLRQSVKVIIEECIDVQENQCNIWMPAIFTLVQLVY
ncbi:Protein transport protein sec31 [Nosema bombycis CQ1]|uniref:Protein transport protein SEC31 n=1 Tax=Nosema bombycis (strain CQ1 / CVCC 102059) TaxID=578461 RepID=R0MLW8_NOSB1|nr:Protein transport protein sec31 [Nosema bombycis CQ1]|eukprot:EOB13833.1 Protein transport protein sec31 [Nosema bombycis CQ1]